MNHKIKLKNIGIQSYLLIVPSALGMFFLTFNFLRNNETNRYWILIISMLLYLLFVLATLKTVQKILATKMIEQNPLFQILNQLTLDIESVQNISLDPVTKGEKRIKKLIESFKYYKQANLLMSRDLMYLKEEAEELEKNIEAIQNTHQSLNELYESLKIDNHCLMETAVEAVSIVDKNKERIYNNPKFDQDYEDRTPDSVLKYDKRRLEIYKNTRANIEHLKDEIDVKSRELSYIKQINQDLITSKSIQEISDGMLHNVHEMYGIDSATIYDADGDHNWVKRTVKNRPLFEKNIDILDPLTYLDHDWENNPTSMFKEVDCLEDNKGTLYISPIEIEGKLASIYCILIKKKLSDSERNIFKVFSNQMAIVIQRAVMYQALRNQYFNTIETLVTVIEAKDKYTEGHSRRVSRFAVEIAKKMGYSNEEIEDVEIAGLLHDVGKIGVDYSILVKEGKLTEEEFEKMKEHPEKAIQILNAIELNQNIVEGILYHHLRYDLSGYPNVDIDEMPEFAAIIGAADAFDAITSARSYSKAKTINEALVELNRFKGTQFSPKMVELFEEIATHSREKIQDIINDLDVSKRDFKGEFNVISSTL